MPVRMAKTKKGKWTAVEPSGRRVYGPTTRTKARKYVLARALASARAKGYRVPRRKS